MNSLEMEMMNISFPESINARNPMAIKGATSFNSTVTSQGYVNSAFARITCQKSFAEH